MRRILMASCGVGGLAISVAVVVWQVQPPAHAEPPVFSAAEPEVAEELAQVEEPRIPVDLIALPVEPTDRAAETELEAVGSEPASLREQYVDLLRRKAELMNDGEIAVAIDELKSDINELEANRKLEAISGELRSLIESHPQSSAARRARGMLERMETGDAPYYSPGPTPARNRPVPDYAAPLAPTPSKPTPAVLPTY